MSAVLLGPLMKLRQLGSGPSSEADVAEHVAQRVAQTAFAHDEPDGRRQQRVAAALVGTALALRRCRSRLRPTGLGESDRRLPRLDGPPRGDALPPEARCAGDAVPASLAQQPFDRFPHVLPGGDELRHDAELAEPVKEQVDAFPRTEQARPGYDPTLPRLPAAPGPVRCATGASRGMPYAARISPLTTLAALTGAATAPGSSCPPPGERHGPASMPRAGHGR